MFETVACKFDEHEQTFLLRILYVLPGLVLSRTLVEKETCIVNSFCWTDSVSKPPLFY